MNNIIKEITRLRVAFIKSPNAGIVFWHILTMPDTKDAKTANESMIHNLKQNCSKGKTIDDIINSLKFLRTEAINNNNALLLIKKAYKEALQVATYNEITENDTQA